jgi:hypothetical protein
MKQIVILSVVLFLSYGTLSAGTGDKSKKILCGKVIDKSTGEALAGVKVEIKGAGTYCYTDLNGRYSLAIPADTKQEIQANVIGYEPIKLITGDLGFDTEISLNPLQ